MANISISEYQELLEDSNGNVIPIPAEPAQADQRVAYTTATQSTAFAKDTYYVRLAPDADCHVKFGSNPTAVATSQKLFAGGEYFRRVEPGHKVSIYDGTS